MSDKSSSASGGIGFTGLLTITFIVLRLTHVIAWPWLWVLSPIWISFALFVVVLLIVLLVAWLSAEREHRRRIRSHQ